MRRPLVLLIAMGMGAATAGPARAQTVSTLAVEVYGDLCFPSLHDIGAVTERSDALGWKQANLGREPLATALADLEPSGKSRRVTTFSLARRLEVASRTFHAVVQETEPRGGDPAERLVTCRVYEFDPPEQSEAEAARGRIEFEGRFGMGWFVTPEPSFDITDYLSIRYYDAERRTVAGIEPREKRGLPGVQLVATGFSE